MDKQDTTDALAAIGMMLQAFPSAQSSITADSPRVYLFAVEEFPLEALKRACRLIVRGEVKDLKADFPPAAPKLAQIVKGCADSLAVERFNADHQFVAEGSETWRKLVLLRGRSLPLTEHDLPGYGPTRGWNVTLAEIEEAEKLALPAPHSEADMAQRRADLDERLKFTVGDPEGAADAA